MKAVLRRARAALLCVALLAGAARAEALILPGQIRQIGAEAFAADTSLREAVIPEGASSIGARAFAGCANLARISIPASVTELGEDFADGCSGELLIETTAGSAAMRYAAGHEIDYQADTAYRALLIGQTYRNSPGIQTLVGPANDIRNMESCLRRFPGTPYQIESRSNITADGIKSAIREAFGAAREQDVSLFYYSGHGAEADAARNVGALIGTDGKGVTADALRRALDEIPGRKIVIIDACFSGNMISPQLASLNGGAPEEEETQDEAEAMTAEDFVNSFIASFSKRARANLAAPDYFVLTASADDEMSWEASYGGRRQGMFTSELVLGCGYNFYTGRDGERFADDNDSGVVTLREAYDFCVAMLELEDSGQHAQVYPQNCGWFGFLRD